MKKFKLRPELSARENLWEACEASCRYILRHKKLRLSTEEWQELLVTMTAATVENFLWHKVHLHKYDRRFDFFSNCYSCAWSVSGGHRIVDKFLDEIRERLNTTSTSLPVGCDEDSTVESLLEDTGRHPLEHAGAAFYEKQSGRMLSESQEEALIRLWECEDSEAEEMGAIRDDAEIQQHRKDILDRLTSSLSYKAKYARSWRIRLKTENPLKYEQLLEKERLRDKKRREAIRNNKDTMGSDDNLHQKG